MVDYRHTDTRQAALELGQRCAPTEGEGGAATLDALLDPQFVGASPQGFMLPREQWLERYRTGTCCCSYSPDPRVPADWKL